MIVLSSDTAPSIDIEVYDDSGLPVTGLVAATMPTVYYSVGGANAKVSITLSDLAAETTAWSSGGLKERGNGVYRLDIPTASINSAGRRTRVFGYATNKNVVAPAIDCGPIVANTTQIGGVAQTGGDVYGTLVIQEGTLASATTTTAVLASGFGANTIPVGYVLRIMSGTGAGQSKTIAAWTESTKTAGFANAWITTPDNTSTYRVIALLNAAYSSSALPNVSVNAFRSSLLTEGAGGRIAATFSTQYDVASPVFTNASVNQTGDSFGRIGSAGAGLTALGDTRLANLDTTVSSRLAPGGTLATVTTLTNLPTITTDWLSSAGVSAGAVTKIQNGLATPSNITSGTITTVSGNVSGKVLGGGATAIVGDGVQAASVTAKVAATIAAGDIATDAITAASVKADAVNKIQNGLATPTNITTVGTVTNLTNAPTTGDLTPTMKTSVATAVQSGMTSQGYTTTRGGYLDTLNGLVAAIWGSATRTLTAFGFTVNTNANATETAIQAKTDLITGAPATPTDVADKISDKIPSRLKMTLDVAGDGGASGWPWVLNQDGGDISSGGSGSAPTVVQIREEMDANSTKLAAIKAKTDNLPDDPAGVSDVQALGASEINFRSPISQDGQRLTIVTGDAYKTSGAQPLKVNIENRDDLIGYVPRLCVDDGDQGIELCDAPAVLSGTQEIVFNDLDMEATAALRATIVGIKEFRDYQVRFLLGDDQVTPLLGKATVWKGLA